MPWSALGAGFFVLVGLGGVWLGLGEARAHRSAAPTPDVPLARRWSPTEAWLYRIGWTTMGLGIVCLGLTTLRYAQGGYIVVPANAQLIDHVIWVSSLLGVVGGFAVLVVWAWVREVGDRRASRRGQ